MQLDNIFQGDALDTLKTFPDESVDCCVTSPPYYGLRDYGVDNQIGLEETPELSDDARCIARENAYKKAVQVIIEYRRKDDLKHRIIERVLGSLGGEITLSLCNYDNNKVNLETVRIDKVPDGNIVIFRNYNNDICVGEVGRVLLVEQMLYAISQLNNEGLCWFSGDDEVVDTGVRL